MSFSIAFTQPTFQRILPCWSAPFSHGPTNGHRRIVDHAAMLTATAAPITGSFPGVWSLWPLGKILAAQFCI